MDKPIERVGVEDNRERYASPSFADPLAVVLGAVAHGGDRVQQILSRVALEQTPPQTSPFRSRTRPAGRAVAVHESECVPSLRELVHVGFDEYELRRLPAAGPGAGFVRSPLQSRSPALLVAVRGRGRVDAGWG